MDTKSPSDILSSGRPCRRCKGTDTRWSRAKGLEFILRFLCIAFYRCRTCNYRFMGARKWGYRQWSVVYAVVVFAMFVVFMRWGIGVLAARQAQ